MRYFLNRIPEMRSDNFRSGSLNSLRSKIQEPEVKKFLLQSVLSLILMKYEKPTNKSNA